MKKYLSKKEIKKIIIKTHALLTLEEGWILYNIAINTDGNILEIGSYKGGSTIIMALGLRDPYKVYSIDPHNYGLSYKKFGKEKVPKSTLKTYFKNIKEYKVKNKILSFIDYSENVIKIWNKYISFLFIDGNHNYTGVKRDFLNYEPFLNIDGIIGLHDSSCPINISPVLKIKTKGLYGPILIKNQYLISSNRFSNINCIDSLTYATKNKNNNLIEKIRNKLELMTLSNPSLLNKYLLKFLLKIDYIIGFLGKKIK